MNPRERALIAEAFETVLEDLELELVAPLRVEDVIDAMYRAGKMGGTGWPMAEHADTWGRALFDELVKLRETS